MIVTETDGNDRVMSSLGYFRFKNILSAFIVHDPARVCDHEEIHGKIPHIYLNDVTTTVFLFWLVEFIKERKLEEAPERKFVCN